MILTETDRQSPLWRNLKEHMTARLEAHRKTNDNVLLTEIETARVRGRIQEIKDFLKLDPAAQSTGEKD